MVILQNILQVMGAITLLLTAIGSLAAAVISWGNRGIVQKIQISNDGNLAELLNLTRAMALKEGVAIGRDLEHAVGLATAAELVRSREENAEARKS